MVSAVRVSRRIGCDGAVTPALRAEGRLLRVTSPRPLAVTAVTGSGGARHRHVTALLDIVTVGSFEPPRRSRYNPPIGSST